VATSALLHATVALALLPEWLPRHVRVTEQAIELTLELPTPPFESPATPAADQAGRKVTPGSADLAQIASVPGPQDAAAAPPPAPREPDVALILPSIEPPPAISARDFGVGAPPPALEPNLEKILPPVQGPQMITGRDFAMTAPPAAAKSPSVQERVKAPPLPSPIRQAVPKRAAQQDAAGKSDGKARDAPSPVTRTATNYTNQQARQDYLLQIVRKLSQSRFYPQSREESERGVVVARLTVARDGRLIDVSLAKSSGFPNLDRSVMDTIRKASPFAPMPAEIAADGHTFVVPINYASER
jgi:TonB family protein